METASRRFTSRDSWRHLKYVRATVFYTMYMLHIDISSRSWMLQCLILHLPFLMGALFNVLKWQGIRSQQMMSGQISQWRPFPSVAQVSIVQDVDLGYFGIVLLVEGAASRCWRWPPRSGCWWGIDPTAELPAAVFFCHYVGQGKWQAMSSLMTFLRSEPWYADSHIAVWQNPLRLGPSSLILQRDGAWTMHLGMEEAGGQNGHVIGGHFIQHCHWSKKQLFRIISWYPSSKHTVLI